MSSTVQDIMNYTRHSYLIGVIGGSVCDDEIYNFAYNTGQEIAKRNAILVCGGLTGVMEAACKGAKDSGGLTIGILPGDDRKSANPYVDIPILTNIGYARNFIIVQTAEAFVAIDGRFGTLSELAFVLDRKKPIVGYKTWDIDVNVLKIDNPREALDTLFGILENY
jgi:uncharacterized protein (TIGR00725 family)